MAKKQYVLGYDFGTLSCRVIAGDLRTGETLFEASACYPHGVISERLPGSGVMLGRDWALQDPDDYLAVMARLTREATRKVPADGIAAMGIDFTNCTVVALGADGKPLCGDSRFREQPHAWVKLWKHHAAQPYAERMEAVLRERGTDWFRAYGRNVSSEWFYPKVLQVYEEAPQVYKAADIFLEAADYLPYWLTGNLARNSATLGVNAFYGVSRGYPDASLLDAFSPGFGSVLQKQRGEIVPVGSRVGTLRPEAAAFLGLDAGVAVAAGHGDSEVVAAGLGTVEPGGMIMAMGTSTCYQMMHREAVLFDGVCAIVQDGMIPGLFAYESGQPAVGDSFSWVADRLLPGGYKEEAARRGLDALAYMDMLCGMLRPGEAGLVSLDWLNGNRSVLMDYNLRGVIAGLSLATKPEHIYRSMVEATAFGARRILESYREAGVRIERVIASGGLPRKSPVVMQLYADILGRDITVPKVSYASALGAGVCAAVAYEYGTGSREAFQRVCGRMARYGSAAYRPDPRAAAVYNRLYELYLELHDFAGRASGLCGKLNEIARTSGGT